MPAPWIRTTEELAELIGTLAGCRALALDTESDSLYHHREKVCLIQLAARGGPGRLIDTLALRDLAPLGRVLADSQVVKVLHGADYDVTTLKRDFGFTFAGVFDTMIAARFLGMQELGLQAAVRAELGVELSKGGQKDDWSRRPLDPAQERYALADVEHLVTLGERLGARLLAAGRMTWAREECDAVAALPPARRRQDPEAYQRLAGAAALPPRALAVLRELHAWREGRAEATDLPPFRVLQSATLLALAATPPRTPAELSQAPEAHRVGRHARALLEAVARGLAVPEAELPQLAPRPRVPVHLRARIAALKAVRAREAERLHLDPALVLPQRLIVRLAEAAPRTLEALLDIGELRRWRIEAFGPSLLDALDPR
ncbi:MAG TPA: HRDC domain-containing protein [Polyangia bacterium]